MHRERCATQRKLSRALLAPSNAKAALFSAGAEGVDGWSGRGGVEEGVRVGVFDGNTHRVTRDQESVEVNVRL